MYLMYVDECGDCGMKNCGGANGASRYFVLSALVLHESQWTDFLADTSTRLDELYGKYGMDRKLEIHAKAMLGRSEKQYSTMRKVDRLMLLRDVMRFEGTQHDKIRVINVVVDKQRKNGSYDVFGHAWDALINRFENTIQHANFPIVKPGTRAAYPEHGMILVDQTDEKKLRELIRRMRWNNLVPSTFGASLYQHNIKWVIEDAMHKDSKHSIPVQLCDVNAYFLRQLLDPNSTVRKHDAQNYFYQLTPVLLTEAARNDPLGIVRL